MWKERTGVVMSRLQAAALAQESGRHLHHHLQASEACRWQDHLDLQGGDDCRRDAADINGFIFGNYDYIDKAKPLADQGKVSEVDLLANDPANSPAVAAADRPAFANSATPMQTITEKLARSGNDFGGLDIKKITLGIALAGMFMVLFLTGNGIAKSVRERFAEFATLKTIGFSDRAVTRMVVLESALPCVTGAALGVGLAAMLARQIPELMPPKFGMPMPTMSPMVMLWAAAAAFAVALLSAALPDLAPDADGYRQRTFGPDIGRGAMNILRQIGIVSLINFRSLRSRLWRSLVIVVGMACVIGVLLSMLSLTEGLLKVYQKTGDPGRALVVSAGAQCEANSSIPRDKARLMMDAPGIAKAADGSPLADPQHGSGVPVIRLNGRPAYTGLRGFGPKAIRCAPNFIWCPDACSGLASAS